MNQPRAKEPGDSGARKATQSLRPSDRVRQRWAYSRCYRDGYKRHGRLISLHVHGNDQNRARLGITVGRKVGNAVIRHRLKRWSRDVFRRWPARDQLRPVDIVVHLKPLAARASYGEFRAELDRLMKSFVARTSSARIKTNPGRG